MGKSPVLAAICAILLLSPRHIAWAITYGVTDLGMPAGDTQSYAMGINNSGKVVGYSYNGSRTQPWCWTRESGLQVMPVPSGAKSTYVSRISDSGLITGWSLCPSSKYCIWGSSDLRALGPTLSDLKDINESGDAVGYASNQAAFVAQDGTITTLGDGHALAINDSDEVVGYSGSSGTYYAFYWSRSTGRVELGSGQGSDINNSGQIALWAGGKAWISDRKGKKTLLPILPGYTNSTANAINNKGQVVGSLYGLAVLWDLNGSAVQLPNIAGYGRTYAYDINENGWIAGTAYDASGNVHAVLWQPVPEPSVAVTLVCGLLAACGNLTWKRAGAFVEQRSRRIKIFLVTSTAFSRSHQQ